MLTATRRQVLDNIRRGKDPYEGFSNAHYGGAIRSIQTWKEGPEMLSWNAWTGRWRLSLKGYKALKMGEF